MNYDAGFVTRLKQRDPDTCTYLVSSLTPVLDARLRYRMRDRGAIEDIRNETFYRVFCLVDGGRVRQPEQFGSFVRGVCDRVAQESFRKARPTECLHGTGIEPPDLRPHLDEILMEKERGERAWRALMQLAEADRKLIVAAYCEGGDRAELARELGISPSGLNVRLCRALKRLRARVAAPEETVAPARQTCRPRLQAPLSQ